jgi:hypothetical protein
MDLASVNERATGTDSPLPSPEHYRTPVVADMSGSRSLAVGNSAARDMTGFLPLETLRCHSHH